MTTLGLSTALARGDVERVIASEGVVALGGNGATACEMKFDAIQLRALNHDEIAALAHGARGNETWKETAERIVSEAWRGYCDMDAASFAPIGAAHDAAFKACGSPHERAVVPRGSNSCEQVLLRARARSSVR